MTRIYGILLTWGLLLSLLSLMSCSDDKSAKETTGADSDTASSPSQSSDSGDSNSGDGDTSGDTDSAVTGNGEGVIGNSFRYGINGGHRNQSWGDDVQAQLEAKAGCTSQRISLPERHLDRWGYTIEVNDMQAYQALGMHSQVAFLTAPIREHATAPDGALDWELAYYIPKNLYEPVTLANGDINPANYWAKYIYDTVSIYSEWIKVWEIWNEPDYTPNWSDTLTWTSVAPTAAQLPRFNGSVFEYIRMLRISREAAKLADPEALIATGGIGYASFLSAILRYTDNPADGSVTNDYPQTGGAYFDVLSFHHYPLYTDGDSNDAVDGLLTHAQELLQVCVDAGKTPVAIEITESGAPHVAVGDFPGGAAYARNYLIKAMVSAHAFGIHGIDWFTLSDGALEGASDDPYDYMGLFEDVVDLDSIDAATVTETGIALATLSTILNNAQPLALTEIGWTAPDDGQIVAFKHSNGAHAYVLWAELPDASSETVTFSVPDGAYTLYLWDYSRTGVNQNIDGGNGATVSVGSAPVFLVTR